MRDVQCAMQPASLEGATARPGNGERERGRKHLPILARRSRTCLLLLLLLLLLLVVDARLVALAGGAGWTRPQIGGS
jgi:hypothetical protein